MASPWQYPRHFQNIPQLVLRVWVKPGTYEVVDAEGRLSFSSTFTDIMLPFA
jgi:hypothetical protein